jgi:hypothetical protein
LTSCPGLLYESCPSGRLQRLDTIPSSPRFILSISTGITVVTETRNPNVQSNFFLFQDLILALLDSPEFQKGSWSCIKCSVVHHSGRALHVCDSCSSLPSRKAKVEAPPLLTSRYIQWSDGSDYEEEDSQDEGDSELDGKGFCLSDERRVAKDKEISEYGRVWTSRDTHLQNEQLYSHLAGMDSRPVADNPQSMWSTIIAFPASEKLNRAMINKKFNLEKKNIWRKYCPKR